MSENPEASRPSAAPPTYWLRPKTHRGLVIFAGAAGLAALAWLVFGPKPWDDDLDFSLEAKEHVRTHAYAVKGLWYGALINLGLIAIALTAWRFRPREMCDRRRGSRECGSAGTPQRTTTRKENTGIIILVIAALGLAAAMMGPRLSLSLWGDEEATARRYVIGNVRRIEEDNSFVLITPRWEKTLWSWDNGPNSHMFLNVLARLSHGPGNISPEDPGQFYFDERLIRLPCFIATLVMIAAAAWLTALLGAPRGSPLVAWFLALHPWVIRYGTEARGYALMMAFLLLAFCFLLKALRGERTLFWWIAFGLAEFLALYGHLTAVYFLIPLNLAALWLAWAPTTPGRRNPLRVADVWRLAGANLLGAVVAIQLMLPNALQIRGWLERTGRFKGGKIDFSSWIENWLSFWTSGMPWHDWQAKNPHNLTLSDALASNPVPTAAAIGFLGLFLAAGFVKLLTRRPDRIWLLPLLVPVPLMILGAWRSKTILYTWYSVGFLPLAAAVAGVGFVFLCKPLRKLPGMAAPAGTILLALAALLAFALVSHPQRQLVRTRSVEPLGEAVRFSREVVNPFHPEIDRSLTLGFVHATQLYDPAMQYARSDEQFLAAVRLAEESGKTLWVNAANLNLARPIFPKAFALLDDREVFEEPKIFHGLQVPCTRYLFRYKPGGLGARNGDGNGEPVP